jgi:transposase InsO family protein
MEANEDPIQLVHSFIGYTRAMRRPRAYIDDFFIGAAAGSFNIQICVIRLLTGTLTPTFYECPGSSFRIILLAASDHYEWCSPSSHDPTSPLPRIAVPWNPPPLRRSLPKTEAVLSRPDSEPHLDDTQPLEHDRRATIARAHNAITGHPGRDATLAALRSAGYNWRGMFADVSKFVERCASCQIARQKPPIQAYHRSIRTSTRICRRWHIDTAGPFSDCSATSFLYLTLFIDEVSGFTLLYGARTKCALEVAVSLLHFSGLFGLPDSFHSDGGREFDSDIFNQFCTLCSVRHNLSIARAPNSNGIAERQVQLVKRVLRQLCSTLANFSSWGLLIPLAQRAVNFLHRQDL